MRPSKDMTLAAAEILRDSAAMNQAALDGDFDEARFRVQLVARKADAASFGGVALAASQLIDILGNAGREPSPGLGAAMVWLADELEKVGDGPP